MFPKPLPPVLLALCLSISVNIYTLFCIKSESSVDDSHYGYEGDDHPAQLPLHLPRIALTIENTEHFGISTPYAWADWKSTDKFPKGNGFVRLGPDNRPFGLSMFHQMHCLQMMREAIIAGDLNSHVQHCFNLMRQAILCASDITLDPIDVTEDGKPVGTDGIGVTHVCRDWTRVYDFVWENQLSSRWNQTS